MTKLKESTKKIIVYCISTALIVASFLLPPLGVVDPSVLMATGLLIGGYEWLFGHSIKKIDIDSSGVHFETHEKKN